MGTRKTECRKQHVGKLIGLYRPVRGQWAGALRATFGFRGERVNIPHILRKGEGKPLPAEISLKLEDRRQDGR